MAKKNIELMINGDRYAVAIEPWRSLAEVLRETVNLTGTKVGCNQGDCGACTVLVDDRPVASCLMLAVEAVGRAITTIEGVAPSPRELHPLQQAFLDKGAVQCGYCTSGMILSAKHFVDHHPGTTDEATIRRALAGNLCRCTGYNKIVEAVAAASEQAGAEVER